MRVKIKSGNATKVMTVDESITVKEFVDELNTHKDLLPQLASKLVIKKGFPPAAIKYNDEDVITRYIVNGDQLIVETAEVSSETVEKPAGPSNNGEYIPSVQISPKGYLILRNIDDDNSCMFNAICYAMKKETVSQLRRIIATYIEADPDTYSEIVLGRTNEEYRNWITKKDSWGGAIELGILSQYYDIKINCIDVESGNIIKFENESSETPSAQFINLIYSGVHYDILSYNEKLTTTESDKANDISIWNMHDEHKIMTAAKEICTLLQTRNYTTNTTKFRLRCLECYSILVGETGASRHANETGHFKFGEVS